MRVGLSFPSGRAGRENVAAEEARAPIVDLTPQALEAVSRVVAEIDRCRNFAQHDLAYRGVDIAYHTMHLSP